MDGFFAKSLILRPRGAQKKNGFTLLRRMTLESHYLGEVREAIHPKIPNAGTK